MKIVLVGGPANGKEIELPEGMTLYRHPVEIHSYAYSIDEPDDPTYPPRMTIADYRFTGQAFVDLRGNVRAVIYEFDRWE